MLIILFELRFSIINCIMFNSANEVDLFGIKPCGEFVNRLSPWKQFSNWFFKQSQKFLRKVLRWIFLAL